MSLRIDKLSKRYAQNWVLKDVTFTVREGEIVGIFGVGDAGKTTLLRLISGDEAPNGGAIFAGDADITALSRDRRGFSTLKARKESFWKSVVGAGETMSDGASDEIALDEALNGSPTTLLLDNPFSRMDAFRRERCREKLRAKSVTTIIALNDFADAMTLCDRVVMLDKGEVIQEGVPADIYLEPANSRVAYISGRNNLIEARRVTKNTSDVPEFVTIKGEHRLFVGKTDKSRFAPINRNNCLTIRPEHISISFGASFPEDNLLKATITGVKFDGATTRVELDAGGLALEAMVLRLVGLEIGEECVVGLPPDRIQVFPA